MDRIGGIPLSDVWIEKVECSTNMSFLHNVALVKDLDRHLRLEEQRIFIVSQGEGDKVVVSDATGRIGADHSIIDSLEFVESKHHTIGMFEMYGTWEDLCDVLILHINGEESIYVIMPMDTKELMRKQLLSEVRRAVRFSEGCIF